MKNQIKAAVSGLVIALASMVPLFVWVYWYYAWKVLDAGGSIGIRI